MVKLFDSLSVSYSRSVSKHMLALLQGLHCS